VSVELPGGGEVNLGDDGVGVELPGPGGQPGVTVSVPPLLPPLR
jgi:hypothetical protein